MTWPLSDKIRTNPISIDDWNSICDRTVAIGGNEDYASVKDAITGGELRHGRWNATKNFAANFALDIWFEAGSYLNITRQHDALWYVDIRLRHLIGFRDYTPKYFLCNFDEESDVGRYLSRVTTALLFHIPFTAGQIDLYIQNNREVYLLYYVVDDWTLSYHGFQIARRM